MSQADFLEQFTMPANEFRSCPYWIWNGDMTEARITETLELYAAQGVGGVVIHARVGLITEYLSERWFELWPVTPMYLRTLLPSPFEIAFDFFTVCE